MAFDLINILIISSVGAGLGLLIGLITTAIGKKRLDKKALKISSDKRFISRLGDLVLGTLSGKLYEKTKSCEFCEKELPEIAIFCAHCGKLAQGPIHCPNCNQSLPEKAEYWHEKFYD